MNKKNSFRTIRTLTNLAIAMAFLVIILGAFTRLSDAGLGCPDWPGCYGHLIVQNKDIAQRDGIFAQDKAKAWTEMIHRYAAGSLGILLVLLLLLTFQQKNKLSWKLPLFILFLIIFQALLGMWTVTLKLLPWVVMAHLLGGMILFASLCCYRVKLSAYSYFYEPKGYWNLGLLLGLVIVVTQIILGGLVSSNYAGIACVGFPQCNGQWWPQLDFTELPQLFTSSVSGVNYQGGILQSSSRVTIQFLHRLGAIVTFTYLTCFLSWFILRRQEKAIRIIAGLALGLLWGQFTLGIANVVFLLPLPIAVAHNGVAALLLASLCCLFCLLDGKPQ